jgi:hypothetical protein
MTKPMMPQMGNGSEVAPPAGLRRTVVIDGEVYVLDSEEGVNAHEVDVKERLT